MKKKLFILLILFIIFPSVNAKVCQKITESNVYTYLAKDYSDVSYCDDMVTTCGGKNNLCTSGCFPLSIASILKSYGNNVAPQDVSKYLCTNFNSGASARSYETIKTSSKFTDDFEMETQTISNSLSEVDNALNSNKVVLASIKKTGSAACKKFIGASAHYITIAMKKSENNSNQYYIINTSTGFDTSKNSGWYDQSVVQNSIVNCQNQSWITVVPKDCTEFVASNTSSSNGSTSSDGKDHSPSEDPYPGAGPNLDTDADVKCNKIFKKNDSDEFNDLGQFLQDVFLGIRLLAPALVIILSTIDYIKAIAASNQDNMKKVNQKTIKRVIAGLIIFFIPLLLDILFKLFGIYDLSTCGIGN